jgi:hypothetical protein
MEKPTVASMPLTISPTPASLISVSAVIDPRHGPAATLHPAHGRERAH